MVVFPPVKAQQSDHNRDMSINCRGIENRLSCKTEAAFYKLGSGCITLSPLDLRCLDIRWASVCDSSEFPDHCAECKHCLATMISALTETCYHIWASLMLIPSIENVS